MRPYELKKKNVCLVGERHVESYSDMVRRLTEDDNVAYSQSHTEVACRIRNSVAMVSDVSVSAGSDMFMLSSYMAYAIRDVYNIINDLPIDDSAKVLLANEMKKIEEVPSQFASARKLQQIEGRKRHIEEATARQKEMDKMLGLVDDNDGGYDDGKDPA